MFKQLVLALILAALAVTGVSAQEGGNGDDAFTLWAVVFNEPENCTDPCGEDDLFENPGPPQTAVVFLAGQRVQSNGRLAFGASLAENATIGVLPITPADSLFDADAAEVHLILRTHGSYIAGIADEQVTTFAGGCDVQTCEDLQFVIFKPADADANGEQTTTVHRFSDLSVVEGAWAQIHRESDGVRVSIHSRLD